MALELQKELSNGTSGNYFSISKIDITDNKMSIKLDLHVSKELKLEGKRCLYSEIITINHIKSETVMSNVYAIAYAGVKEPHMIDGVECNEFAVALDV